MSDAPRVDDVGGCASVDCLAIWGTEQQPEEQHESAVEDKVFGGGDHRGWNLRGLTFDLSGPP